MDNNKFDLYVSASRNLPSTPNGSKWHERNVLIMSKMVNFSVRIQPVNCIRCSDLTVRQVPVLLLCGGHGSDRQLDNVTSAET